MSEKGVCIPVGGKNNKFGKFVQCSEIDFERLNKYNWTWTPDGYACSDINKKRVRMSRFVLNAPEECLVDHIDGNRSNNTRSNLRIVNFSQNAQNRKKSANKSSKFLGVSFSTRTKQYVAQVKINKQTFFLGRFDSEIEAAKKRDIFVVQNNGYHKLNFPDHISVNKKRQTYGPFDNVIQAAKHYDQCVVDNKLDRPLNFKEDYPNFVPDRVIKSFVQEIEISNINNIDSELDVQLIISSSPELIVLIERADYDLIKYYACYVDSKNYVTIQIGPNTIYLHRFIMNVTLPTQIIDHVYGNTLDNRRRFLRITDRKGNATNVKKRKGNSSSKYIGVHFSKSNNNWVMKI